MDLSKAFAELIILTASRTLMGAGRALFHCWFKKAQQSLCQRALSPTFPISP